MFGWKKRGLVPSCLFGIAVSVVLTALFCLALTPLFLRGAVPLERTDILAPLSAGLAVFAAVLFLTKTRGRQTMPTAGIVAGGFVLLTAVLCALGGRRFVFGAWLWHTAVAAAVGALLGAVMSIHKKPGKRRRRR